MVVCVCVCVLLCVVGGTCYGQASPQARHASKALAAGLLPPGDDGAMHRPAAADCRCRCRALPARPPQVPDSCASSTSSPCNAVPSLPSSAPRGGGASEHQLPASLEASLAAAWRCLRLLGRHPAGLLRRLASNILANPSAVCPPATRRLPCHTRPCPACRLLQGRRHEQQHLYGRL